MAVERKATIFGPVLITRPEPSASATAEKLVALGFSPVSLPLSRTVALPFHISDESFDALTVTSANVFCHVPVGRLEALKALPLFAVGEGTARAAHKAGFETVIEGGGDAMRLAQAIARHLPKSARLLYLAGRVRQPLFEDRIAEAGLKMHVCDVYDVEAINYSANEISAVIDQGPFVAVLLYSAVTAQNFVTLTQKFQLRFEAETRFFCISERVARELPQDWQASALVADHPDENGIFRLFSKL